MSISPNVPNPQESYHYESAGTPRWIAVLFGLLFAAVAVLGYMGHQAETKLESDLSKQEDQNKVISAQLEQANARLADLKGHLDVTEQKIGMTRAELAQASSRAETIRRDQIDVGQEVDLGVGASTKRERRKDWRGGYGRDGSEERHRGDQDRPGGYQEQAGACIGRHGRDERIDCAQP